MSALTHEHWHELKHIATVTDRGGWTHRSGNKLLKPLLAADYIAATFATSSTGGTFEVYQITPAGIAALATKSEGTR
jgi:hypothetical protein